MQSTSENMFLELFCQIISEPCFNTLRTKEQLGKKTAGIEDPGNPNEQLLCSANTLPVESHGTVYGACYI